MLNAPILSAFDPATDAEGSVDPLGLETVYDRLANLVLPGLTVRMSRPRFLTAVAVGALICADYEPDDRAKDGNTPPYLVFEWWVVEAFVRSQDVLTDRGRIPGFLKVSTAVRNRRPVSASSYLKTASVFGYNGIFRRLARRAQILGESNLLDEAGYRLAAAWADDQHLTGFVSGTAGIGADFRADLTRAVRDGMRDGQTSPRPAAFWHAIAANFDPARAKRRECALLLELINDRAGQADDVHYLVRALQKRGSPLDFAEEAQFLRSVTANAPPRLRSLLRAIDAYEAIAKPLVDAFDWIRVVASREPLRGASSATFQKNAPAVRLVRDLRDAIDALEDHPVFADVWPDRASVLGLLRESATPDKLFGAVLHHHRTAQANKPPDGKRPWVEEGAGGRIFVRSAYARNEMPVASSPYVHDFRLPTLSQFLHDLGAFR